MPVQLNHTIIHCTDKVASARFLAEILGLPKPKPMFSWFMQVDVSNGVSLDLMEISEKVQPQHYAFLVTEPEFDQIWTRIKSRGLTFWADPGMEQVEQINRNDGGRGLYWQDPNGHLLEIITRPYGSGGS